MDDVMKKRLIGVAVLVVIGVLTPLLLSKCMHGGGDEGGDGSMRVYNVNPNGAAESASKSSEDASAANGQSNDQDNGGNKQKQANSSRPDAVSPQSESSEEAFSTPPVKGRSDTDSSASEQTRGAQTSSHQSQPAPQKQASHESTGDQQKSSSSQSGNQSTAKAQRNDSASGWVVQVAAFGDAGNARALANELSGQYRASYAKVTVNGKTWYRVNIGPFAGEDAARSTADSLKKQGRKPLVRHLP